MMQVYKEEMPLGPNKYQVGEDYKGKILFIGANGKNV